MVTTLFNRTAAFRILTRIIGSVVRKVEAVRQLKNTAIQVTYRIGRVVCSTFVSAKEFEQDFETLRQDGARSVTVKPWISGSYKNHFQCQSEGSSRVRTVKLLGSLAICSCEDHVRQQQMGDGQCKHVLATLAYLGYQSMRDYVEARSRQVEIEEKQALASLGF